MKLKSQLPEITARMRAVFNGREAEAEAKYQAAGLTLTRMLWDAWAAASYKGGYLDLYAGGKVNDAHIETALKAAWEALRAEERTEVTP